MRRAAVLLCLLGCSGRRAAEVRVRPDAALAPVATAAPLDAAPAADAPPPPATLHEAALRCDHEGMATLLARGAAVDARNREGRTPLHEAAGRCALSTVKLLVAAGADVNARDADGLTPLHEACSPSRAGSGGYAIWHGGDTQVVAYLIARGADPRAASLTGWTPLHAATQVPDGGGDVVALLLDRGAEIDARDAGGWTPLHQAARFDAAEVAGVLVARGASPAARTGAARTVLSRFYPSGSTPLDIARASGARRAIELLERPK